MEKIPPIELNEEPIDPIPDYLTYHPDPLGGFYTTSLFWECSCERSYIHPHTQLECPTCSDHSDQAPPARLSEVMRYALEWQLDQEMIQRIVAAFPYEDPEIEPDEGPLVEQYENAVRLHEDDWLETAYEDRVSGWYDDF